MEVGTLSFSVMKPKITSVSQLTEQQSISNLSMVTVLSVDYSDHYTHKLYRFQRGPLK